MKFTVILVTTDRRQDPSLNLGTMKRCFFRIRFIVTLIWLQTKTKAKVKEKAQEEKQECG